QNGGTEAYAIRVVKSATSAETTLQSATSVDVLKLVALDQGATGNGIAIGVSYPSGNASNFNLTLTRAADNRIEVFNNLSMNSADARYALDQVNGVSKLVRVSREVAQVALDALTAGTSQGGTLG